MIKPLKARVVTSTPATDDKVTESGIVLSGKVKDEDNLLFVEVLAIGPDVQDVKVGDNVLVMKSLSHDLVIEDKKYWAFDEDQILAIKE